MIKKIIWYVRLNFLNIESTSYFHIFNFKLFFTDPCKPGNSKILHVDGDRSISCKDKSMSLCDNMFNNEWYRVQRNGIDLKMPNTCVDQYSCGTKYPVYLSGMPIYFLLTLWHIGIVKYQNKIKLICIRNICFYKGPEPAISDKAVSRNACVNDGHMCSCTKFYNIQLRNCSSYIVYNLTSVQSCPERYCFGK